MYEVSLLVLEGLHTSKVAPATRHTHHGGRNQLRIGQRQPVVGNCAVSITGKVVASDDTAKNPRSAGTRCARR